MATTLWHEVITGAGTGYPLLVHETISLAGEGSNRFIHDTIPVPSPTAPLVIVSSWTDLQNINFDMAANYSLTRDLLTTDSDYYNVGHDFLPIGWDNSEVFSGTFNGNGHSISGLTINLPSYADVGMFYQLSGANISDLDLLDVSVTGDENVGALSGNCAGTQVTLVHVTGTVVGGMASSSTGGLLGVVSGSSIISRCSSLAEVFGGSEVGGLLGQLLNSALHDCYAKGNVLGLLDKVGGLVGKSDYGTTKNSYAAPDRVTGGTKVGGLFGSVVRGGSLACNITNCYAVCSVVATGGTPGGLIGYIDTGGLGI